MGFNVSTELNSTVGQLQGLFSQIESMGDGSNSGISINSIFSIQSSIEQIQSDDSQARANGITNLVDKALKLIDKITNLQAAAKKAVDSDSKKADRVIKRTEKTKEKLDKNIEKLGSKIGKEVDAIGNYTEDIIAAQQELDETQKQIDEIIKQIEDKQAELAAAKTPEEEKALLEEINALGASIVGLTKSTQKVQKTFDKLSNKVLDSYEKIETAKGNSIEIQTEGEQSIVQGVQEASTAAADTGATQASGAAETAAAASLEAGSAISSFVPALGAILSTSTAQKAAELAASGATKTSGSISNFQKLAQGIGGIQNNTELLANFKNTIGSALQNFDEMIGGWNNVVTPLITSLGTLGIEGTYAVQANALSETVAQDKETIAEYLEQDSTTTSSVTQKTSTTTARTVDTAVVGENKKPYVLETPSFKFGI